jgi:hypothetical protein
VARLKLLLAPVGVSLEQMEACSYGGQELATMQASPPLGFAEQMSSAVEEKHLYSCFSPCGSLDQSSQTLVSATYENERIDGILAPILQITLGVGFEKSSVVDDAVSLSHLSLEVPIGATVSGAVVAREVCDFLASLVAAYN